MHKLHNQLSPHKRVYLDHISSDRPARNMSRFTTVIIGSIILSLVCVHGSNANQQQQASGATDNREVSLGGPYLNDVETSLNSRLVGTRQADAPQERDDYHSNIDLNQINEAYRYEMLDGGSLNGDQSYLGNNNNGIDMPRSSDTLIGRMFNNNNNRNRYYSKQDNGQYYKGKRIQYPALNLSKEDKDYTFVGYPQHQQQQHQHQHQQQPQQQLAIYKQQSTNQDLASRGGQLAADVLRDLLMGRQAQNRLRNLDPLSSTYLRQHNEGPIGLRNLNDLVGNPNREKRRRCKMDPNLGVKNPSFCDTDAYFGAADYGVRDVWDSAGRR